MAGVYGEINSRADFFRVLGEASRTTSMLLGRVPQDPTIQSINAQLEAVKGWTARGRQPTEEERSKLDMGVRAMRELENTGDPVMDRYVLKIYAIANYFEDWPSDEVASKATDADFFNSFG